MAGPVLSITMVARRLGISTRTIHVYAEEGFIRLERRGARCLVDPVEIENIVMIERLKADLGVNLAGVGVILEMRKKIQTLRDRLDRLERDFEGRQDNPERLPAHRSQTSPVERGKREILVIEIEDE